MMLWCEYDALEQRKSKRNKKVEEKKRKNQKQSRQHPDFPGGHPPEYYPSLRLLNFAERTGYGAINLRWPSTTIYVHVVHWSLPPSTLTIFTWARTTTRHQYQRSIHWSSLTWSTSPRSLTLALHIRSPEAPYANDRPDVNSADTDQFRSST